MLDTPIVDAHHHIWDLRAIRYPALALAPALRAGLATRRWLPGSEAGKMLRLPRPCLDGSTPRQPAATSRI